MKSTSSSSSKSKDKPHSKLGPGEYKPDIAKKMLTDAGYPALKTQVAIQSTWQQGLDIMALVKQNFAAAGIEMEIKTYEPSSLVSIQSSPTLSFCSKVPTESV